MVIQLQNQNSTMLTKISIKLLFSLKLACITLGITWLKLNFFPSFSLIWMLLLSIGLDLVTGVAKAWLKKENTTSEGLRRTVVKFIQYGGFIICGVILVNLLGKEKDKDFYEYVINGLFTFTVLIELLSICENVVEISPNSKICRYIIYPFMKIVKGKLPKPTEADQVEKD